MKDKKDPTRDRNEPAMPEPGGSSLPAEEGHGTGDADRPREDDMTGPGEDAPALEEVPPPEEVIPSRESEYLDDLRRLTAEFANYRRRVQRERAEWETRAKGDLMMTLLPVLDDLRLARDYWSGREVGKDAEGMLMILARLEDLLKSSGLEAQDTEPGTPFDPHLHEALATGPSDEYPEGTIIETLRRGYMYRGIMLRPARVRVSQGPPANAS